MKTYTYTNQQKLFKRAAKVIPGGIYGHYSPAPLVPATDYPFYTAKAKGSHIWDLDGNEFIDYMCAYGPMVHGYGYDAVDKAAREAMKNGSCTTGAPPVMVDLAEYLVKMTEGVSWAFFAKNGADTTNYAVMIARDATNRKKIIKFHGSYHGTTPWMQGRGHHGVIPSDVENIISVPWNDLEALRQAIKTHRGQIAALIASPYLVPAFQDNDLPLPGFWPEADQMCKNEGILIISDDIRHGFRINLKGSHAEYGYDPDLVCYCKAIGNGYPISACLGTDELKPVAGRIFHTGSYWFQAAPMAAALASLKAHRELNTPKKCRRVGEKLTKGLVEVAASHDYHLKVSGAPAMPYLRITSDPTLMLHQKWCAEATKRGAFFTSHHNWFMSNAHSDKDIEKTLAIADDAFGAVDKEFGSRFKGRREEE